MSIKWHVSGYFNKHQHHKKRVSLFEIIWILFRLKANEEFKISAGEGNR